MQTFNTVISLTGAVLILLAYWANAAGRWSSTSRAYALVNLVGSLFLGASAVITVNPGFIVLEIVWAGISLVTLLRPPAAETKES